MLSIYVYIFLAKEQSSLGEINVLAEKFSVLGI
jgi:hypothetical protein